MRGGVRLSPRPSVVARRDADLFLSDLLGEAAPPDTDPPARDRRQRDADLFLADLLGEPRPKAALAVRAPRLLPSATPLEWLPVEATIDQVGEYSLRRGAASVPFWPLAPGTTIATATPAAPAAGLAFGIVDLIVRVSADPVVVRATPAAALAAQIVPASTATTSPLAIEMLDRSIRICFAVTPDAAGADFTGTLRLTLHGGAAAPGTAAAIDLPLRVPSGSRLANLVVFAVPHRSVAQRYAWTKLKVSRQGAPATVLAGVPVTATFLRDNLTFAGPNRQLELVTDAGGFAALGDRNIVAYPIGWPLIFKAREAGSVPRGHLVRLGAADIHDNGSPHQPATLPVTPRASASLAGQRILLDAGHGVVYALAAQRRSQEWFVAHRICERVAELLQQQHGVLPADIFFTRTAGFGLIDPADIGRNDAPERGGARYELDLPHRRVKTRAAAVTLRDLSDLLLVQHTGAGDTAQPVTPAERDRLLATNAATIAAIEARLNAALAPTQRVRPASMRWDTAGSRYVFTREPVVAAAAAGAGAAGAAVDLPLPIQSSDWFDVDDPMMRNLADRSARWSRRLEIGSGPAALGARPSFVQAARAAMDAAGALDYMRDRILHYVNVPSNHEWRAHGIMAWSPAVRQSFMNATACDLYVSVHENAAGGRGGMALVAAATAGAERPPDDQIRLGKVFLKYLDPLGQGLRQGGIAREVRPATLLASGNVRRGQYAYLEIEFMDAIDPADATRYRYQEMVGQPFVDRVAEQIVAAIVEARLSPQNSASVTLNGGFLDAAGAALW